MQDWKINDEVINKLIADSKEETFHPEGSSALIVSWTLPNGYTICETSGCVNPKQYDEEIGLKNCREKLKTKLYELEGYYRKYIYQEYETEAKKKKSVKEK